MQKKAFSLALLLSLSLPVMQLDAMLDDLKDLASLFAGYVIKTGTIAGAVGGTWFLYTQVQRVMSKGKGYGSRRGYDSGSSTSGSEQSVQTLMTLLNEHKGELQTQLADMQNNCSQTVEANKEQLWEALKVYKNDLDSLKILVAQQENNILGKMTSQLDGIKNQQTKLSDAIIKRLEVVEKYKAALDQLGGRLDAVEQYKEIIGKLSESLKKNEQAIIEGAQHIDGFNQQLGQVETRSDEFHARLLALEGSKETEKTE